MTSLDKIKYVSTGLDQLRHIYKKVTFFPLYKYFHVFSIVFPCQWLFCGDLVLTGSTIRNWHKVKTWFDQMFWQIYQKLMLSGFLSSGNLCLINHLKLFWPHAASTASDRKGCKIQHEFSWLCQKKNSFQNIKRKWY